MTMVRTSSSVEETIKIGENLARRLKAGDVVALVGDLGSGKTVLTKGIAKGLGVKNVRYVNSPTFVTIKEHAGRVPLYHLDVYRVDASNILDSEGYEEYLYSDGVTVIEWADRVRGILPKRYTEVRLSITGENRRRIEIRKTKNLNVKAQN
jgi:tRNA threonylcarbamoyladenosine biosynthesis protein TsaE